MRWSKLKGQQWSGATLPIFHEGHFTNVEMQVSVNFYLKRNLEGLKLEENTYNLNSESHSSGSADHCTSGGCGWNILLPWCSQSLLKGMLICL